MHQNSPTRIFALGIVTSLLLAACGDSPTSERFTATPQFGSSGPTLVECPSDTTLENEGEIGPLGGEVTLENHRLVLPELAVSLPHQFRLVEPAGKFMELRVTVDGQESFAFDETVTITLDYSRCTRSNIDHTSLTVWKIDPVTKELIKHMGGVDDPTARTVTFRTDSLSTYVIAD